MEWHPIETAPRDGTPILVWDTYSKRAIEARWEDEAVFDWEKDEYTGGFNARWAEIDSYGAYIVQDASHWMPLPDAPK